MLKNLFALAVVAVVSFSAVNLSAAPISGSVLWLDAQDIDNDGNPLNNPALSTPVSNWADKAALQGAQDATQSNPTFQPTYVPNFQNGQAAIQFSDDILDTSSISYGAFTIFTAFSSNSTTAIIYERGPTENSFPGEYFTNSTGSTVAVNRGGLKSQKNYISAWGNSPTLLTTTDRFNGTHASQVLYVSGEPVALTSHGSLTNDPGVAPISEQLHIGARLGPSVELTGHIAELLVYDSSLNSAQTNVVNNYLSAKYDSAMTLNDLYAGDDSPTEYDFDVFGIGSEVDGTLSTNSFGSGLTLTEANSSLTSGEYLLAGIDDSNPSNLVTTDLVGAGAAERLERDWFLDKTGTLDATISFNLDELGVALDGNEEFKLLYRSGLLGDFNNLGLTASLVGNSVSFEVLNADLSDGFYTLGVSAPVPEPSSLLLLGLGMLGLIVRRRSV